MSTPSNLELRTLVKATGELELSLVDAPMPQPKSGEVLVRVEAAPINPSDIGLMFAGADPATVKASGSAERPVLTAPLSPAAMTNARLRLDRSLPAGLEGAGVVITTGDAPEAKALLGKTVAAIPGGVFARYKTIKAADCLVLPAGVTPREGAACFVNPLTALGMTETMKREGHTALAHTAAASNLGQMLARVCLADGIGLVNIVRRPEQAKVLRDLGSPYVCCSSDDSFEDDLTEAMAATGATIGFDAVGGGTLAAQMLTAMERAGNRKATASYSPYGVSAYKQVYIYGSLDNSPTVMKRAFGMTWGVGGWLLFPFLGKIGEEASAALKARVAREVKTTFASHYAAEVSLAGALTPEAVAAYTRRATGEKYLINPAL